VATIWQCGAAQPEQLDGLGHAAVRLAGGVHAQWRVAGEAMLADVEAGTGVAGGRQRGQGGHGAAADQQPTTARRQADQLAQPADDLALEVQRGMVATCAAGVHRSSQQRREHRRPVRRRIDPAVEARVTVAEGMRQHRPLQLLEQLVRAAALLAPLLLAPAPSQRRRDRLEHGPLALAKQVVQGQGDHALPVGADGRRVPAPGARQLRRTTHGRPVTSIAR
jgi:hypothetical protein